MFSDRLKTRIAGIALAGAALALVPSAASAGVIVKSTGPSSETYPVGRQMSDRSTITLRNGDRVTVLTSKGTRVMQGPGTFRVGEGARRTRQRFSNLTRRGASGSARTGASRGDQNGIALAPSIWFVNVAAGGTTCLYDFDAITLWRADASQSQTYRFGEEAGEMTLAIPFVVEETDRVLDQTGMTIEAGTNYTITAPPSLLGVESEDADVSTETVEPAANAASAVNVNFVQLEEDYPTPDTLAQALLEKGCMTQFALLADSLDPPAAP